MRGRLHHDATIARRAGNPRISERQFLQEIHDMVTYAANKAGRYYFVAQLARIEGIWFKYDDGPLDLELLFTNFHQLNPRIEGNFFILSWEST